MPARRNPLLVALRNTFPDVKCYRVYTTVYKDRTWGYRVKFYGCRDTFPGLVRKLRDAGFGVTTHKAYDGRFGRASSVTITAVAL